MRVSTLVVAFLLVGCADPAPEASTAPDVAVQAPTTPDSPPAAAPDTASVTPSDSDEPTSEPPPAEKQQPEPPVSDALLPRPVPMPPAVPVDPPPNAPARTEAADAFWASFKAAIRAGDRAAIEAGLSDVVTVGEVEYPRNSPQVQSVLDQIVENEQVRDAYLGAGGLVHGPEESAFSSVVRVETPEGDVAQARLSGALRAVAPGDWRLIRLRTDPVGS